MSRCVSLLVFLSGLYGIEGVRHRRKTAARGQATGARQQKFVAGVPVHNFHLLKTGLVQAAPSAADWVVALMAGTTDAELSAICERFKPNCKFSSGGGAPFLEVHGTEEDLHAVLEAAGRAAKFVEPDLPMAPIPELGAVDMEASVATTPWNLETVGVPQRPRQGRGVHVFVVDTGVRTSHGDFGGRAVATLDMTSGEPVECGADVACADDFQGHGTHCAGIVGGRTYGVASEATVHSMKVFAASEAPFSWSYAALNWIGSVGQRPAVASMSLGGEGKLEAMKEAVDAAVAAGVTLVAAAGNFDADSCGYSPAFVPSAITVGATTQSDARWSFSNFGPCVDIWAPGIDITSAGSFSDDQTKVKSGSSMACPHVSGGAALLLEANPQLSPAEVRQQLLDSANVDGVVLGLTEADNNLLLWVGEGVAPAPTPLACPDYGSGPDADGDCRCRSGRCYEDGGYGCTWSRGSRSSSYFLATCGKCVCRR